jgi:uncharacterized glyoxalase superfamily protein PhnB
MPSVDPRELVPTAPELFVPDVDAAARFYTEKLGFELLRTEAGGGQGTFAVIALRDAVIMLADERHYGLMGGQLASDRGIAIDVRLLVEDVDAMYRKIRNNGVPVVHEIGDRPYGLRDFIIRDLNGFRIRFASPLR